MKREKPNYLAEIETWLAVLGACPVLAGKPDVMLLKSLRGRLLLNAQKPRASEAGRREELENLLDGLWWLGNLPAPGALLNGVGGWHLLPAIAERTPVEILAMSLLLRQDWTPLLTGADSRHRDMAAAILRLQVDARIWPSLSRPRISAAA